MAAQAGRQVLIQVEDDDSPASYTSIGGLRTKTLNFNGNPIDITSDDDTNWQTLLDGEGVKSVEVSGSGVFKDDAAYKSVFEAWQNNTHQNYKLTIPDFKTIEGKFAVSAISGSGEYNEATTYELTLMSTGAPAFTDV